jgi:membrane-bound metal-dependent hydrolase YbcI (DUF457 family)
VTYGTHTLIGAAAALPVADHVAHGPLVAAVIAAALFGSLLPDADHASSKIHQPTSLERDYWPLRLLGLLLRIPLRVVALLPHRGPVTHGPLIAVPLLAIFTVYVLTVSAPPVAHLAAIGLAAGYLAHLAADGCTVSGLPRWPAKGKVYAVPRGMRIVTGTAGETVYAFAAAAGMFVYYLVVFTP